MSKRTAFILFLLLSIASFAMGQKVVTVTVDGVSKFTTYVYPDTVRIRDTVFVRVPCDTTKPVTPTPTEERVLYISSTSTKLGTIWEDETLKYLKDYGYTGVCYYDLSAVLSNATRTALLKSFNKRLRAQGITRIEGARGDAASYVGAMRNYNATCADPNERFTAVNLEYEFWNMTLPGGWVTDSTYLKQMADTARSLKMDLRQYLGWFPSPVQSRAPRYLGAAVGDWLIHYYRTGLDSSYGKYRVDSAQAVAKSLGVKQGVMILISAEPAFMQTWLKTHTLTEVDDYYRKFINSRPNLYYAGCMVFHDDYMKVSQPVKTSPTVRTLKYVNPLFTNTTTDRSLQLSVEPK